VFKDAVVAAVKSGNTWTPVAYEDQGKYGPLWYWAQNTPGCKLVQRFYDGRVYSGALRVSDELQSELETLFK
jgi:hypothetical protein